MKHLQITALTCLATIALITNARAGTDSAVCQLVNNPASGISVIEIPVEIDLVQRFGLNNNAALKLDPTVTTVKIYNDGRVFYGENDISANVAQRCTKSTATITRGTSPFTKVGEPEGRDIRTTTITYSPPQQPLAQQQAQPQQPAAQQRVAPAAPPVLQSQKNAGIPEIQQKTNPNKKVTKQIEPARLDENPVRTEENIIVNSREDLGIPAAEPAASLEQNERKIITEQPAIFDDPIINQPQSSIQPQENFPQKTDNIPQLEQAQPQTISADPQSIPPTTEPAPVPQPRTETIAWDEMRSGVPPSRILPQPQPESEDNTRDNVMDALPVRYVDKPAATPPGKVYAVMPPPEDLRVTIEKHH